MAQRLLAGTVFDEEIKLELDAIEAGVRRYRRLAADAVKRGQGSGLKAAERLLLHWYRPYLKALRAERRAIERGEPGPNRATFGPLYLELKPEKLAVIGMNAIVSWCLANPDGVKMVALGLAIGNDVLAEINLERLKRDCKAGLKALSKRSRQNQPKIVNEVAREFLAEEAKRAIRVKLRLGCVLIWNLLGVAACNGYDEEEFVPALQVFFVPLGHFKRQKYLRMRPEALEVVADGHHYRQYLSPRYKPMICEPFKWREGNQGGYIKLVVPLVKKTVPEQREALKAADLSRVHAVVDALNATPWRVNRRILEVAEALWKQGGGVAGIPNAEDAPLPAYPPGFDAGAPKGKRWKGVDADLKAAWRRAAAPIRRQNIQYIPVRMEFLQKLGVANEFADREAIWFPHALDWRGRAYPMPLHLNHQGDDVARGLLEFSEGRPLGERGMFWLRVHAANCYGMDKCSLQQRVEWVDAHRPGIWGNAMHPLEADDWTKADKPFQFLAACMALANPEQPCHLPVQMDGSCNGLQHYAALGRDSEGAAVVNLTPGEAPGDLYSIIARKVADQVARDAEAGDEIAKMLEGRVCRAWVKQPVMTSVYGVTPIGAREQVKERLEESGIPKEQLYKAAIYLSKTTLAHLKGVCVGAGQIMDWLASCARLIAKSGKPVAWTTPLGFPVVQPYRKWGGINVRTVMGDLNPIVNQSDARISVGKQVDGFPPNFIHSIDATHMLLTALACQEVGIAFAGVHDSYWTHAADVDRLHFILREAFVDLHLGPILDYLRAQLTILHPTLPARPDRGDFNINDVMSSTYFFS